jgi:acetyl-CoA carboxylase biotin carboxyl carrier protein
MSSPLISNKDIEEILRLVQAAEHVASFRMKYGDFEISLSRDGAGDAAGPARGNETRATTMSEPAIPAPAPSKPLAAPANEGLAPVTAPMVGTFYRSPSPGSEPFVSVGSRVEPDTVIGIIEVMKLMNSLNAGVKGTVRQVLAEDSRPVGYGQVLMLIEPDT